MTGSCCRLPSIAVIWGVAVCAMTSTVFAQGAPAALSPTDLARYLPADANAVVRVMPATMAKHPQTGAETEAGAILHDLLGIPDSAVMLLRGTHWQPHRGETGSTSVALINWSTPQTLEVIKERAGSEPFKLGECDVWRSPRKAMGVLLGPNLTGYYLPPERQAMSRWLSSLDRSTPNPAVKELTEVVAASQAPLIAAIDFTDAIEPGEVETWINGSVFAQGKAPNLIQNLVRHFQDWRRLRIEVQTTEPMKLTVSLDFGRQVSVSPSMVAAVATEYMDSIGASLDELSNPAFSVSGPSVILAADLSPEGLQRLMTVLLASEPQTRPRSEEAMAAAQANRTAEASRRYFMAINRLLADLEGRYRRSRNYDQTAVWHDSFAQKIEQLPSTGVDRELLTYGDQMALYLRALGASLRGVSLDVKTLENTLTFNSRWVPPDVGFNWGWGFVNTPGQWEVTSNLQQVKEQQAQSIRAGSRERQQIWQQINNDRVSTRRAMEERYGISFENANRR